MSVECFTAHWHLELIEGVLHHVVCIQLVDLVHDCVHAARRRVREKQELGPRQRLEACQAEPVCLEEFQARHRDAGVGVAIPRCGGRVAAGGGGGGGGCCRGEGDLGGDGAGNCVDTALVTG